MEYLKEHLTGKSYSLEILIVKKLMKNQKYMVFPLVQNMNILSMGNNYLQLNNIVMI